MRRPIRGRVSGDPSPTVTCPRGSALDSRLRRVRTRWIARDSLVVLSRAILAVVPACLLLAWLDWRLGFPPAIRFLELAAIVAAAAGAFVRHAVPALRKRRDPEATALQVEAAFPGLCGRLVSRVELRRRDEASWIETGASPSLARAFCERVEREVVEMPIGKSIAWRGLRWPGPAAAIVVATAAALAIGTPDRAVRWLERTVLPFADAPWPRRTRIEGIGERYLVRRGDRLRLSGRALGEVPASGEVTWWPAVGSSAASAAGKSVAGSATFDLDAAGRFSVSAGPVLDSLELALVVGDSSVDGVRADAVIPPELESVEVVLEYPSFTRLAPQTLRSGDVRAIVGTRVDLTLRADRPVARMEIVWKSGDEERREEVPVADGVSGRTSFRVRERATREVRLHDENGFQAETPASFVVEPIENELPAVEVTRPGAEHVVTPASRPRLAFRIRDDFGVSGARLSWRRRPAGGDGPAPPESSIPLPVASGEPAVVGEYPWDLAPLGLSPGDEISWRLEARDDGEHLAPDAVGRWGPGLLTVVAPEVLRGSLEARRDEAVAELDWMVREESRARDAVSGLILSLPAGDEAPSPATLPGLLDVEGAQERLRRQAERLDGRIAGVADELDQSFLEDPARVEALRGLALGLRELCLGAFPAILEDLGGARVALDGPADDRSADPDLAQARARLEAARAGQEAAIARLESLASGETRTISLAGLLADLAAVRDMQSSAMRGARSLLPRTFGKSDSALTGEDRKALETLAAESRLLRNRLADWQRTVEQRASVADAPASLRALARDAAASPADEQMEKASAAIERNRLSEAASLGRSASDELSRLVLRLEVASLAPEDLGERRLRALEEVLEREKRLAGRLGAPLDQGALRQARREQFETSERARPLGLDEAALPPEALDGVRAAGRAMESAEALLARERQEDAALAARSAAESLAQAAEILRVSGVSAAQARLPGPARPPAASAAAGGAAGAFGAGGGVDLEALSRLAADIALVARLREREDQLLGETLGKRPEEPAAAARQQALAAQIPQLSRRVEVYLPPAATILGEVRSAMAEASDRLGSGDRPSASAGQRRALDGLRSAEESLRGLWDEILEALASMSRAVESGPAHGGATGTEEERRASDWTVLIREIVRLGRLMKEERTLISTTRAWVDAPPAEAGVAKEATAAQRGLATRGEEIASALRGLGDAGSLIEALEEAVPFLAGAADMLESERYEKALQRQEVAMEYLGAAWTVVTQSAAATATPRETVAAEPGPRAGSESAAAALGAAGEDARPWYWDLPPRARDAVMQSVDGRFPPRYASAIERYYERLAARRAASRSRE